MTRPTARKRRDLGIYRRIYVSMWLDSKFRGLSSPEPNAQFLWMYLLCGPSTVAAPGVIRATRGGMADELGWEVGALQECFDELQAGGMVEVDWGAGVIFLPKATAYNPPASPNAVKAWAKSLDHITECPLKVVITQRLQEFLQDYGEGFLEPFREQLRYPGAGAGTGYPPISPLAGGTVPQTSSGPGSDPAPEGAAGSDPSPTSEVPAKGKAGERKADVKAAGGSGSDSTGTGDEFALVGDTLPEIPTKGRRTPGCTICRDKVPGVMFRRSRAGEPFTGEALAAMCWGCHSLECRNEHRLPVPITKNRGEWKRFEHAFPENKRLRKRDRERFTSEAAARTHRLFEIAGQSATKIREAQEQQAAMAPKCDHCKNISGLVFRKIAAGWEAGLCHQCGGSPLYAKPPEFMGPPLRRAGENSGWLAWTETPGAGLGEGSGEEWRKAAVNLGRKMAAASVPTKSRSEANEISLAANEISLGKEPQVPSDDDWDDDVSGEPPPL